MSSMRNVGLGDQKRGVGWGKEGTEAIGMVDGVT